MSDHPAFSKEADGSAARRLDEMSRWYMVSRAIHVAAELGIAELIGDDPVAAADCAGQAEIQPLALERLLRLLASYGVFEETDDGRFKATELSNLLRDDHPRSLRPNLRRIGAAWWGAAGDLGHSVATGEPAFRHVNGMMFFEYLAQNPDQQRRFDEGMAKISEADNAAVASAYDFSGFATIVDVGGGRGGLLAEILARAPRARGVLFDQPQVVAEPTALEANGLLDRCDCVGGDFFGEVPPGGDCYIIKGVLHDFTDGQCVQILANCRAALAGDARLLVVDRVLPTSRDGPHANIIMDVQMMYLLGGRERRVPEWHTLFGEAGLKVAGLYETDSDFALVEGFAAG